MNRLIIVGNGFDLSLGLKTRYTDFLFFYLQKIINQVIQNRDHIVWDRKLNNTSVYQDDLIKIQIPTIISFKYYKDKLSVIKSYGEFVELIRKYGRLEFKFILLENIHKGSISNNWVDFEIMYYDTLIKYYEKIKTDNDKEEKIRDFHNKFELFKNEFIEYLQKLNFDYSQEKVTEFYSNTSKCFLQNCHDRTPVKKLHLLNFNYTKSVEELKHFFSGKNIDINYIHGKLEDKDSVIFGFGDEMDENYKIIENERSQELFKNIKSVHYNIYPNYGKLYRFISNKQQPYEVFIYGHSCGVSDRTLLNEILENENCKSVRIFYYKKDDWDNFQEINVGLTRQFTDKIRMRHIVRNKNTNDVMYQVSPQ